MDRLLSGKSGGRLDLDNDKNKKRLYNNTRRHYKSMSSSNVWHKRISLLAKIISCLAVMAIFLYTFSSSNEQQQVKIQLRDQPVYKKHDKSCFAKLCNPSNKCSTWLPNKRYSWSDLSQAGVFRDLSTIEVSTGCELKIKVDGEEVEWLTIPQGVTECTETGYGAKCRNFVDLELKGWNFL
jgi:hypothetical protein